MDEKDFKRFMSKVRIDEDTKCWIWIASTRQDGYGQFRVNGTSRRAHRVIWEHFNGKVPNGKFVLHNCPCGDNSLCVNPDHLWIGTQRENIDDMYRKGRGPIKLTKDEQTAAFDLYCNSNLSQSAVAEKFGVTQGTISRIFLGKT